MSADLMQQQDIAVRLYAQLGLPSVRDEDWKYTDVSRISALLDRSEGLADIADSASAELPESALRELAIRDMDATRLVFVDGVFDTVLSDALPDGVRIDDHASFDVSADLPLMNGFVALNAAAGGSGVVVTVAKGVRLAKPLYLLHISLARRVMHVCHDLALDACAEAQVVEHYCGMSPAAGLSNVVSNIRLGDGAQLVHYRVQQEETKQFHVGHIDVRQARDSRYVSHVVAVGGALARVDLCTALEGAGASCELNGVYLTAGRQHVDHHTVIEHRASHCSSRENYRGVLDGRSRAVFNGKVVVAKGAVKTDSAQSNANLLLSSDAEIDTKPELQIDNDDVKCAHGATVGQLDEKQLFYLQSRGMSAEQAREVLTFAFISEVMSSMDIKAVRYHVERAAFACLPHSDDMEGMLA